MILNGKNGSNEATRVVMIFLLCFTDLSLKSLESFEYSRLKQIYFILTSGLLLSFKVLLKQQIWDILFDNHTTINSINALNQIKLFNKTQIQQDQMIVGNIIKAFACW